MWSMSGDMTGWIGVQSGSVVLGKSSIDHTARKKQNDFGPNIDWLDLCRFILSHKTAIG